jgi:uncharacterized protein (PEP-CTERM system associated)
LGRVRSAAAGDTRPAWAPLAGAAAIPLVAGLGCAIAAAPALAENWRFSASASATQTYTSNVNYSVTSLAEGDWVTSINGAVQVNGEGRRLKLNGSIGGTASYYATQSENNSFGPSVNLAGTLEAIENFAYLDAQASVSQTFVSPFGAQPPDLVNATQNRYTQQTYVVSPYIKGVFGSSNISYQLRNDNYWTVATSFGDSSSNVPNTYSNSVTGSMSSPVSPWGWSLEYSRFYYSNGISNATEVGQGAYTTQQIRLLLPYQIDPQLQIGARIGYEGNQFPVQDSTGTIYGVSGKWNPTPRTSLDAFWEHRFFGSSYSVQFNHRLPNAALSANAARGINSYPQLALAIPAGAAVSQFLNAAFTTRIPDPAERAQAVEQFLTRTPLPPTLASPVNFYAASLTLQDSVNLSLVLIGTRNSVALSAFYLKSEAISGKGNVLPPALQFGQNNTQTGVGVNYGFNLSPMTSVGTSASYSRTTNNASTGQFANTRSNNAYANASLSTRLGPKTTGSASVGYSWSNTQGDAIGGDTSSLNASVTVSHTF